MRILVVHAHPVETSFNKALFRHVIDRLNAAGHQVDALDLYAENFEPCMTGAEREAYHDLDRNRANVTAHVDRLLAAEALVMVYPVWNYGFPAILKGWIDRVFLPGVSFALVDEPGQADLAQHPQTGCGLDLWRLAIAHLADGRSAAQARQADAEGADQAGRAGALSHPLQHEPVD